VLRGHFTTKSQKKEMLRKGCERKKEGRGEKEEREREKREERERNMRSVYRR
jgi:hypothetical protein